MGEKRRSRALPRPVWRSRVAAQTQTSGRTSGTSPLSRSVEGTLSCCAIEPPHLVVVVLGWWWSCMRSCTIGGRVPREVSGPARQIALRANSVASLPTGGPKRRNVPRVCVWPLADAVLRSVGLAVGRRVDIRAAVERIMVERTGGQEFKRRWRAERRAQSKVLPVGYEYELWDEWEHGALWEEVRASGTERG